MVTISPYNILKIVLLVVIFLIVNIYFYFFHSKLYAILKEYANMWVNMFRGT